MIPNGGKCKAKSEGQQWHYLALRKLSALLRGITSKHNGDFYYLNCLHFFKTKKTNLNRIRVCENKDFCNVIMPSEDIKISDFNQYQKSYKAPFIYADLECIIEKNWPEIPDHPYGILIIVGGSGSGKTNALLNLINNETDIDKLYLYANDPNKYGVKYQLLINKRESTGLKYLNDSKAFIECSNDMDHIYENIVDYNPNKKQKLFIVFHDMCFMV